MSIKQTTTPSAFQKFVGSTLGRWVITAVLTAITFGLLVLFMVLGVNNDMPFLIIVPLAIFAIFGWKSLNRIQPDMFLFLSFAGWAIYILVKFILSCVVGSIATPIFIGKKISVSVRDIQKDSR